MYFALRHLFGSLINAFYFESTKRCNEDMKIMVISLAGAYQKLHPTKSIFSNYTYPVVMLNVSFYVYTG